MSLISALKLISDNPDTSTIPPIKGVPLMKIFTGYLLSPCLILKACMTEGAHEKCKNSIMNVEKETVLMRKVILSDLFD